MEKSLKEKIISILSSVNKDGLKWKLGKAESHLEKRKRKGHIPQDFTLKDYERVIISIMNDVDNDVYLYYLSGFRKDYFVFGNGNWIAIIGEDGIMETAFQLDDNYNDYLAEDKGYEYLGKVKEVLKGGQQ